MLTVFYLFLSVCLQVAHMTKSEMHLHDLAFLGPGLLFLDQYFNSFIDEYLVLWIALVSTHYSRKPISLVLVARRPASLYSGSTNAISSQEPPPSIKLNRRSSPLTLLVMSWLTFSVLVASQQAHANTKLVVDCYPSPLFLPCV